MKLIFVIFVSVAIFALSEADLCPTCRSVDEKPTLDDQCTCEDASAKQEIFFGEVPGSYIKGFCCTPPFVIDPEVLANIESGLYSERRKN